MRSAISVSSRTILRAHGVRFLAVSQNIDTDQSNTTSRLMLHILAAVSEFSDPTMARIAIHHYAYIEYQNAVRVAARLRRAGLCRRQECSAEKGNGWPSQSGKR